MKDRINQSVSLIFKVHLSDRQVSVIQDVPGVWCHSSGAYLGVPIEQL
jgi:hypothetical protein